MSPPDDPGEVALYAPLLGASFDPEVIGYISDSVRIEVPSRAFWLELDRRDVNDERRNADPLEFGAVPPILVASAARADVGSASEHRLAKLALRVADAVAALRLLRPGWFLDPSLFALTLRDGNFTLRRPGPYRQAMMGGLITPLPPYDLAREDIESPEGAPCASNLAALIAEFRDCSGNAAADIALSQFRRSFGYSMTFPDRAATLFTALDAMFGGMSADRIGRISLKRFGFRKRMAAALVAAGVDDAEAEADWLDSAKGGRAIRNSLSHGRDAPAVRILGTAELLRLEAVVRAVLPGFLAFAVRWKVWEEVPQVLELGSDTELTAAYNRALEGGLGRLATPPWLDKAADA